MRAPPFFIQGDGVNACHEFMAFLNAVADPAAHLLAEFMAIQENGSINDIPVTDRTRVGGMYCRRLEGWVVFYIARQNSSCRIGVVHVGSLNPQSYKALENEAESRLREWREPREP
jgi:hypothetical protein